MRHGWKVSRLLTTIVLVLISCSAYSAQDARYVQLTILHTNDTHAHLMPFNYPTIIEDYDIPVEIPEHRNIGGIARRARLINEIKAKNGADVLLLDAGDILDGSPFSAEFGGLADIDAMNACGYDAMVAGNHEYYQTLHQLTNLVHRAKFPIIGANVFRKKDDTPVLTPYIIKNEDGMKVAILGLTTKEGSMPEVVKKDPIEFARQWVPKLRAQADAVILLTHIGFDQDKKLAEEVPGIDAIIGGHSHTRLEKPVLVKRDNEVHPYWVGGTVIAQDYQWGGDLGEVDLTFRKGDAGWTLMSYDGRLIPITSKVPEDPKVKGTVDKYYSKIASKYEGVLCKAAGDFTLEASYNLVSDALRETYNADFAVQNYGGVRTGLVEGNVTFADVTEMFPFNNDNVVFKATGAQVKQILRKHLPAVSNVMYRVENDALVFAEIGGEPIVDDKWYTGATHSYFAGYACTQSMQLVKIEKNARAVLAKYLAKQKTIFPHLEKRAVF